MCLCSGTEGTVSLSKDSFSTVDLILVLVLRIMGGTVNNNFYNSIVAGGAFVKLQSWWLAENAEQPLVKAENFH